jgi:hypothetical protein
LSIVHCPLSIVHCTLSLEDHERRPGYALLLRHEYHIMPSEEPLRGMASPGSPRPPCPPCPHCPHCLPRFPRPPQHASQPAQGLSFAWWDRGQWPVCFASCLAGPPARPPAREDGAHLPAAPTLAPCGGQDRPALVKAWTRDRVAGATVGARLAALREVGSGQIRPGQARPGRVKSSQVRSGQVWSLVSGEG